MVFTQYRAASHNPSLIYRVEQQCSATALGTLQRSPIIIGSPDQKQLQALQPAHAKHSVHSANKATHLLPTHAVTPTTVHTAHLQPILTSVHVAQTQVTQANISHYRTYDMYLGTYMEV